MKEKREKVLDSARGSLAKEFFRRQEQLQSCLPLHEQIPARFHISMDKNGNKEIDLNDNRKDMSPRNMWLIYLF